MNVWRQLASTTHNQLTKKHVSVNKVMWNQQLYVDTVLLFGLRSAPQIFKAILTVLCWTAIQRGVSYLDHFLDECLTAAATEQECLFKIIPNRWCSWGWTGTLRNALSMSILAKKQPWLSLRICLTASWTFIYVREHIHLGMSSLTIEPSGCEMSRINRHLSACFFGTAPRLLVCTYG